MAASTHTFTFVTVKILDWEGREEELRVHENPVTLFVLAQVTAMRTKKDPERRLAAKLELILLLQGRGMGADDLRHSRAFTHLPLDLGHRIAEITYILLTPPARGLE